MSLSETLKNGFMCNTVFRIFVFTCLLLTVYLVFSTHKEPGKVIWSDGEGYYVYLPSVFIFHDFVKDAVRDTGYIKAFQDTGKIFSKYTCGVAILEMPFFLASHWYTKFFGFHATGKTDIYGRGLCWSAAFYLWAGMIFLYYYIKKYYSSYITMLAIAGILCGTNLYFYTFLAPFHVAYIQFLFILRFSMDDRFYVSPKITNQRQRIPYLDFVRIASWNDSTDKDPPILLYFYFLYIRFKGLKTILYFM
jgi:hypothetical protein